VHNIRACVFEVEMMGVCIHGARGARVCGLTKRQQALAGSASIDEYAPRMLCVCASGIPGNQNALAATLATGQGRRCLAGVCGKVGR